MQKGLQLIVSAIVDDSTEHTEFSCNSGWLQESRVLCQDFKC